MDLRGRGESGKRGKIRGRGEGDGSQGKMGRGIEAR